MTRAHVPCALAAVLVLSLSLPGPRGARAEDPALPGGRIPKFTGKDVVLAEAGLPEGWKVAAPGGAAAEEKALREGIAAVASESKEPDVVPLVVTLLAPEGKGVALALVDPKRDPDAFAAAAKAAVATRRFAFADLGSPARIVLAVGPDGLREQAVAAQVAWAARTLAESAAEAVTRWRTGKGAAMAAYALAEYVLRIDPKHAPSHLIKGDMIVRITGKNPAAKLEDAITHFRAALAKDATSPLAGDPRVEAHGLLGESLMGLEPPQHDAGRDALLEAVKGLPGSKLPREMALRFRYNLACAHARLKETDAAFALLGALLDDLAKAPEPKLAGLWRTDPDFEGLRADPRWAELEKQHPEPAAAPGK